MCTMGWTGTCTASIRASVLGEPLFHTLLVLPVAEMDFKVVDRHARARGIQLSRTVMAANTGEILIFDVLTSQEVVGICHRGQGFCIDGGITHHTFKGIIGVGLFKLAEASCEPVGWRGLHRLGVSHGGQGLGSKSTHSRDTGLGRVWCIDRTGLLRPCWGMDSGLLIGWRGHRAGCLCCHMGDNAPSVLQLD